MSGAEWDYKQNGADWPDLEVEGNKCGMKNQSPIDLRRRGWPVVDAADDNFNKFYTNQKGDIPVVWNGHTSQTAVNKEGQDLQKFTSQISKDKFGGGTRFNGVQFHFHHGSEHTIDGERYDLEMHTVHLAEDQSGDVKYAAMGIMFSVDDYDEIAPDEEWLYTTINEFFDSL